MKNKDIIWAYFDGKMEESDILLFEKKMASDSQLRKEYEELVQLNSLLSNQFQWSAPAGLEQNILSQVKKPSFQTDLDFNIIKVIWAVLLGAVCFISIYFALSGAGSTTGSSLAYTAKWSEAMGNSVYTQLLESCKMYIYLGLICAALFSFSLTLEQSRWFLFSTRYNKL